MLAILHTFIFIKAFKVTIDTKICLSSDLE